LSLCGGLSYELYLIHGPFLIKYNPIFCNFENNSIIIGIFLWLGIGIGLAYTLKVSTAMSNMLTHSPTS
jgi:peptidoglycan/LPS O-acetylase OafA/YrhL